MATTKTIAINFARVSERIEKIQKNPVFQEIMKTEPGFSGTRVYVPLSPEKQAIAQSLGRELIELLVVCQRHGKRSYKENKETFLFLHKRWPLLRLGRMDGWHYLVSVHSENYSERNEAGHIMCSSYFYTWLSGVEAKRA